MGELERSDIQGNILQSYGFRCAWHGFVKVDDAAAGRALIDELWSEITSQEQWPRDRGNTIKPRTTLNLALSHPGLLALGVRQEIARCFPAELIEGMYARSALLDDHDTWEPFWRERPHVWLSVHASDEGALELRRKELEGICAARRGIALLRYGQLTHAHFAGDAMVEHFGFRDGLSSPVIAGSGVAMRPGNGRLAEDGSWQPLAAGEFLLGHVDESGDLSGAELPAALARNGTFVVYRKLEQHVQEFRRYLADQAQRLGRDPDELAAQMVGRRRDGTPLIGPGAHAGELNDFSYEHDGKGARCPFGAHIRRVNPRDAGGFPQLSARHQMLRRGMSYGPVLPAGADDERERGLLFIAINASIERQFEFVQRRWLNDGASVGQGADRDPIAGAQPSNAKLVIQGDPNAQRLPAVCVGLPRFVSTRGGEYFFMPGMAALAALARGEFSAPDVGVSGRPAPRVSDVVPAEVAS